MAARHSYCNRPGTQYRHRLLPLMGMLVMCGFAVIAVTARITRHMIHFVSIAIRDVAVAALSSLANKGGSPFVTHLSWTRPLNHLHSLR